MLATENVWRSLPLMHKIFAVSAVALFGATLLMFRSDYADEWRKIQRVNNKLQTQLIDADLAQLTSGDFNKQLETLTSNVAAADTLVSERKADADTVAAEVKKLDGEFQKRSQEVRFKRAERDVARANYDLAIRDQLKSDVVLELREKFNKAQALVDDLESKLQVLQAEFAVAQEKKAQVTKEKDLAQADLKKFRFDLDRLSTAKDRIAPTGIAAAKRWLMELPIVEGFNGHLKINQIWLPNLQMNYGGMKNVARFDRCTTCHVNIDRVGAGNVPAFPHDPEGINPDNAQDYLSGKKKLVREDGTKVGYAHPYSTHPNPELYLTSASPHPMQKFGCTSCHNGCGSGTSFQNASHSPNSPAQAEEWKKKYGYSFNHYWEYPMQPKRMMESTCLQCHHDVVELGVNPTFGASAPKLYRGYELITEYGCYGCHEINGYNAGQPIGPDIRLEPQTQEEIDRLAEDPGAKPGTFRKVGPGLRHYAAKTSRGWTEQWVKNPRDFRPETRMPQFFDQPNQQDGQAHNLQPVEIAGVVEYLFAKSEQIKLDNWAADYTPNVERGKLLFAQRGCVNCHAHEEMEGINPDFGPDLTTVHKKLVSAQWLYSWIREPSRHSARTRMPNLYLDPETVNGVTVDPAADIVAWLLSKGPQEYSETALPVILGADLDKNFTTAEAARLGLSEPKGVRVTAVTPFSPAARAAGVSNFSNQILPEKGGLVVDKPGLQLDDVILSWNDEALSSAAQVDGKLSAAQPGTEVTLTLWRDGSERKVKVRLDRALDALVRMNLVKVLSNEAVERVMAERKYPTIEADRLKAAPIKPDEIELAEGELNDQALLRYIGRRTISRYGCFGCHEIPGFEKARPIGTALQDWGRKDPSKLALEHIEEYLHHHGEKDGSSTMDRVARAVEDGINGRFPSAESADKELSAAYYVDQINHHGRGGFLWQKLREPRSYDYKKVETKGFDERLKMPRFPFTEADIEAVATFVLGLTAEPPAREFVYQPKGADKARIEGEKLITKFNCSGCHMLELPEISYAASVGEFRLDLTDEQKEKLAAGESVEVTGEGRWNALKDYLEGTPNRIYAREVDPAALATVDLSQLESITKGIKAASEAQPAVHIPTDALLALHDRLRATVPDAGVEAFYKRFLPFVETLAIVESTSVDHPQAFDALMKLKPPMDGLVGPGKTPGELLVKFKALVNSVPDPEDDPADQEFGYDLWETLKVANKVQVPSSRMLVPALKQVAATKGRGGEFAEWLTNHSMANDRGLDRSKARQMAPPPLYKEGVKVQTPWLYSFLKNPGKIRYTPLLRMPQFSLSDQEAQTLANYFAAVDGAPFPYQPIPQRDPAYLEKMESAHANYLKQSWDLVTMAPPTGLCAGCHSVGGREFVAGDPTKVVRGPNLEGVYNRLQPDWVELWVYNPKWITPYTSMPQNFPAGKQQFPELFGGDGQLQSVASRDALMNYLRMLEKTGKPTPTPAAAPAAAAAAASPGPETAKVEETK